MTGDKVSERAARGVCPIGVSGGERKRKECRHDDIQ